MMDHELLWDTPHENFEYEPNGLRRRKKKYSGNGAITKIVGAELAESGLMGTRASTGKLLWYHEPQLQRV
ncbi:hypothetical protein VTN49DRAFT_2805 [Thermomyces lanuginosus]|uniref:uncharacterized protein n=1 Tax=Thermomyces lanuginosus TaxID=5541 RepID=UPI00374459B6